MGRYLAQGLAAPDWPISQSGPMAQAKGARRDVVTARRPRVRRRGDAPVEGAAVAGGG
jgi:hypothetical protein